MKHKLTDSAEGYRRFSSTLVFAKAGQTEAVFQLLLFNLASYRADE
jgi:hypothetical protein